MYVKLFLKQIILEIMTLINSPLVSWGNGAFMIAVFAFVCVILVVAVLLLMFGGKKPDKTNSN